MLNRQQVAAWKYFLDWNQSLYECTQICSLIRPTSACLVFKNANVFQLRPSLLCSTNGFQRCPEILSTYLKGNSDPVTIKKIHENIWGEWRYSSTFLDLGTRWRWVVGFTPLPPYRQHSQTWLCMQLFHGRWLKLMTTSINICAC
jgi:hypothetical protein